MRASVNYDELVRKYQESLTTVLRGFRTGAEFLDAWVPDDDHHESILNLAESAESAGLEGISIQLSATTAKELDLAKLGAMIGKLGTVRAEVSDEGMVLEIQYE